jgi:dTDP-4-dehydrorhamnose 3,5-epimerase-like enzyme
VPGERRQRTIEAVVTFTALMHADERGELSRIEEAQRALDRLGIVVRFAYAVSPAQPKGVSRGK